MCVTSTQWQLAEIAAQKAVDSRNPLDLAAGKYTVILEPAAVLDIVGFMFWDFGGQAILDQRSFLNNRIGTQLFGDEHHDLGRRLSSAAVWRFVRWGRHASAAIAVH